MVPSHFALSARARHYPLRELEPFRSIVRCHEAIGFFAETNQRGGFPTGRDFFRNICPGTGILPVITGREQPNKGGYILTHMPPAAVETRLWVDARHREGDAEAERIHVICNVLSIGYWRKLVGVEPTRDTKCRTTGF